jgi:hypothetical protein
VDAEGRSSRRLSFQLMKFRKYSGAEKLEQLCGLGILGRSVGRLRVSELLGPTLFQICPVSTNFESLKLCCKLRQLRSDQIIRADLISSPGQDPHSSAQWNLTRFRGRQSALQASVFLLTLMCFISVTLFVALYASIVVASAPGQMGLAIGVMVDIPRRVANNQNPEGSAVYLNIDEKLLKGRNQGTIIYLILQLSSRTLILSALTLLPISVPTLLQSLILA